MARIDAIPARQIASDPDFERGVRDTVAEAVDYVFAALAAGPARVPPIPVALLGQARVAARRKVEIDTVLRRYIAGHSVIVDFILRDAQPRRGWEQADVVEAVRIAQALLDAVTDAVRDEYHREARTRAKTSSEAQFQRVCRLLAGEGMLIDHFDHDFDAGQIGLVASGVGADEAVASIGAAMGRRLLIAQPSDGTSWAWFASRQEFDWSALDRTAREVLPRTVGLAAGEPRRGLVGWRRSHGEAKAALALARMRPGQLIRYGRNELRVTALNDDLLNTALRDSYLAPLKQKRGANVLCETIRAYRSVEGNAVAAASLLSVSRQTVASRIRTAESLLGRRVSECGAALDVALWLEALDVDSEAQGDQSAIRASDREASSYFRS